MNAKEIEMTEDQYEELLDELYETVQIGSLQFSPGRIVREMDPIAFRCGLSEEPEQWECQECDTEHETQSEAIECCVLDHRSNLECKVCQKDTIHEIESENFEAPFYCIDCDEEKTTDQVTESE